MVQEKDMVMQEYLSLKEANKQLKEQARPHRRHPSLSLEPCCRCCCVLPD